MHTQNTNTKRIRDFALRAIIPTNDAEYEKSFSLWFRSKFPFATDTP